MTVPFFFALLFFSYLLTLLQTTWFSEIFPPLLKPDLMLIFVVYVGTLPYLLSGAVLVSACGLMYELFSGGPAGLFLLIFLLLFFLLKFLAQVILIGKGVFFRLFLVFGALVVQHLLVGFLPWIFGILPTGFSLNGTWILSQGVVTSLLGWPTWILFRKIGTLPRMAPMPESA